MVFPVFKFKKNILLANSEDPVQTPHNLGLHCLHMSHKKDAKLICGYLLTSALNESLYNQHYTSDQY